MLTVIHQISERVKFRPNAIALRSGGIDVTYAELQLRADRFTEYLRQQTNISNGTVAICMERSVDWVVAALAAMQAGAAYVPLDPAWPEARIRYAIENSGAVALVARTSMLERLQVSVPGIDPSYDAAAIAAISKITEYDVSSETLAYVIYTSGSTGVPKGVEITHANLTNLVKWHCEAFQLLPQDRASQLAGLGFDATAWEIWPVLCAGATLCIPDEAVRTSPELVRNWMLREKITIGFVPSVYAASMMEMEWPASTALRILLTGGDVLQRGPSKQLPFDVVNNYGPTECTVVATSSVLQVGATGAPPIGKAIAGTTIYLLDEDLKEVAVGTPGEIYIGGDKVARGYRDLPELTAERFVTVSGSRLYRSGDRGARCPDGQIQFLGRVDRQVKIRGMRLELDEVGSVLSHHQSVSLATVVAANLSGKDDKQLVAYVIFKPEYEPGRDELVHHLSRSLPEYMIPAAFVRLPLMPLTASGKIDFAALPAPSDANLLLSASKGEIMKEAVTPLEQQLLGIIQHLLDGKSIGVNESVFLAGGDSLFGMQLIIMLQEKFGVELSFDQIFEAPTVRELAPLIEEVQNGTQIKQASGPSGVLSMKKGMSGNPIFWVHYLNLTLDTALGQERPVTFLMLTPQDMNELGEKPSLAKIAAHLVQKIVMTQPQGPYTIGGYCIGAVLAYEIALQLQKAGHVVDVLLLIDPPSQSYLKMRDPLSPRLSNPGYLIKRLRKLGPRASWLKLRERFEERLRQFGLIATEGQRRVQKFIEAAASTYRAETYNDQVLMLLAKDRPPHINFLPEWQALIPNNLDFGYVSGHHSEIMEQPYIQYIADTITVKLKSSSKPLSEIRTSDIHLVSSKDDQDDVEQLSMAS